MGYKTTGQQATRKVRREHPIWRGIGCIIIVIVPILSFAAANVTLPFLLDRGLVPNDLLTTPRVPDLLWYVPVMAQIYGFLFARYAIGAILMLTFLYIVLIGGFFSVLYALMYRAVGPSRYGTLDAPPPRVKTKKYTR